MERKKTKVVAGRGADLSALAACVRPTLLTMRLRKVFTVIICCALAVCHGTAGPALRGAALSRILPGGTKSLLWLCGKPWKPRIPLCEERPGAAFFQEGPRVCVVTKFCLKSLTCLCLLDLQNVKHTRNLIPIRLEFGGSDGLV